MNLIKVIFEKYDIPLEKIGFVCTDGAPAKLGCKSGFVALLKEMNSNLVIIYSILHRYALMSKTLPALMSKTQLERSDGLCSSYRKFYPRESDKSQAVQALMQRDGN